MAFFGQICVLCGKRPSTRKGDHQPPDCLYPSPRKPNLELHKVPACQTCNRGASTDDEEFKIIFGILAGEERSDSEQVIESMQKTLIKNKRLTKHLALYSRRVYVDRGRGILERIVLVHFDSKAYSNVISRIVRGLHWRETQTILPPTANISVRPFRQLDRSSADSIRELMNLIPARWLNESTFAYKCEHGDNNASLWLMQFFGVHQAFAMVHPEVHKAD